jgi:hypothetical protein
MESEQQGAALSRKGWVSGVAFLSIMGLVILAVILLTGVARVQTLYLWGILAVLIILLLLAIGQKANGKWYGVLIDVSNRVSLSRLQITLWTIIVVSVYLAIGLNRAMPHALKQPTAEEIEQCKAEFLKNSEGIDDINQFRSKNQAATALALERANDHCTPEPLKIYFPTELLLALGISTASFAGSTLLQSIKRNKRSIGLITEIKRKMEDAEKVFKAKEENFNQLRNSLADLTNVRANAVQQKAVPGRTPEDQKKDQIEIDKAELQINNLTPQFNQAKKDHEESKANLEKIRTDWEIEDKKKEGLLKVNDSPQQASLGDIFQGDEIGNYQLIDLSKVQMFFFTVAIIISYGATLGRLLENSAAVLHPFGVNLPAFSATLNGLLGISHAGYLAVKSVDQTKTG